MALVAVAADKGAPGVTTASVMLAAVWPRPVLLAECDPAGGDLVYRLPAAGGGRLDPGRGLLSLAVAARRGLRPEQVWEHTQKLRGGLEVLAGVSTAEQGAGLDPLWGPVGAALARLPQGDVIADCGRIGVDGPHYDLLAQAAAVVLVTRHDLGEVVRLRERVPALAAALDRRDRMSTTISVVVIADHERFHAALAEVGEALGHGKGRVNVPGAWPTTPGRRPASRRVGRQARQVAAGPHRTRCGRAAGGPAAGVRHAVLRCGSGALASQPGRGRHAGRARDAVVAGGSVTGKRWPVAHGGRDGGRSRREG